MDPKDKDLLITWRAELIENIDIESGILNHLVSKKILNSRMVQNITVSYNI